MTLEDTLQDLLERHDAAVEGSAERRFLARTLTGLRYSSEEAGSIIESLNPFGDWFARPPPTVARAGAVLAWPTAPGPPDVTAE